MLSRLSQDHPLPVEGPLMLYICPAGQYPHPISKSVNTVKLGTSVTKMKNNISVRISSAQVHVPKGVATPQYAETSPPAQTWLRGSAAPNVRTARV